MTAETIAIASDHAGFALKQALKDRLQKDGFAPLDLGTTGRSRSTTPILPTSSPRR